MQPSTTFETSVGPPLRWPTPRSEPVDLSAEPVRSAPLIHERWP
jgi:hypothetical protein